MLLNFQLGENCPCPDEIREELYDFHEDLLTHCGELRVHLTQDKSVPLASEARGGREGGRIFFYLKFQY